MMSSFGAAEDRILKFKAAKSVLIKIKNRPEEKPEDSVIICLFFIARARQ